MNIINIMTISPDRPLVVMVVLIILKFPCDSSVNVNIFYITVSAFEECAGNGEANP